MSWLGPKKLFALLAASVAVLVLARGLWIAGYEPVTSDNYLWGAFHVHSSLSDGLSPLEAIAEQAKRARIDVLLLSDHGAPHPEAALSGETIHGVHIVGGSEVGLPEGHLIVSDVDFVPEYKLPPYPPDAVDDVRDWGGFSVLTYPEDPTHRWLYWEDDFAPDAIEIINVTSYFRASSAWDKLAWAVFSMFNRHYYISSFEAPTYALERWDELLTRGRVLAFYAANAHGGFPLTERWTVGVPSYETSLGYVGIGIDRELEGEVEDAIRRGEFFAIVRGAGEPRRFELLVEDEKLRVSLEVAELSARIVLKRNGSVVAETTEPELVLETVPAGVYRAEVYLDDHVLLPGDVPWILSNPVFVDTPVPEPRRSQLQCDDVIGIHLGEFHAEKDADSSASLELDQAGALSLTYHLSKATQKKIDRWVALARREPIDLSAYRGVYVHGSSPEPMRYWIELRRGEEQFYASFKVDATARGVAIPWEQFYTPTNGRKPLPLADLDAMFVSVNTSNSRTGFSSALQLREIGWCR